MSRMSAVRSMTLTFSFSSSWRSWPGDSSPSQMTVSAPVEATMSNSSRTFPEPTYVAGSGRLRRWTTPSSTVEPAVSASRASSSSEASDWAAVPSVHTPTSTTRSRRSCRYSTSVMSDSSVDSPATRRNDARSSSSNSPVDGDVPGIAPSASSTTSSNESAERSACDVSTSPRSGLLTSLQVGVGNAPSRAHPHGPTTRAETPSPLAVLQPSFSCVRAEHAGQRRNTRGGRRYAHRPDQPDDLGRYSPAPAPADGVSEAHALRDDDHDPIASPVDPFDGCRGPRALG